MRNGTPRGLAALLLLLFFGLAQVEPGLALAQDDPEEEEEEEEEEEDEDEVLEEDESPRAKRASGKKKRARPTREIVKGPYTKVNLGPVIWLPNISAYTSSTGSEFDFSFGYDIIDQLGFTLAAEISFHQLITNGDGVSSDIGAQIGSPIQGDFRLFGVIAAVRAGPNLGGKRVKRLNISGHVGGGVGYSPPLVDLQDARVTQRMVYGSIMQGRALGLIQGGVGLEYYTRLSHFSLGLDVDFNVIVGGPIPAMGLGLNFFAKYTF